MRLILQVRSYRGEPPPAPLAATFGAQGGTLGRAPGNHLVLDDPGKYISRSHASVTLRGGRFYLLDAGSNPSIVNERPLGPGAETALADGDRVAVGDYLLQVRLESGAPDATLLAPAPPAPPAFDAPALPPFDPPPLPAPPPLPVFAPFLPPPQPASSPRAHTDAAPDFLAAARILDGAAGPPGHDPLGLGPQASGAPAAQYDHTPPERQAFAIPSDYDPLAGFGAPMTAPIAAPIATPPAASPLAPPVAPFLALPVAPPAAPPPAAPAPATDSAVLQALLDGLGLPQLRSSHPPEQLARLAGEMLRALAAGTMDVLVARALTKRESHIDMTMIAPRANNPLKFFPDAGSALTQMLGAQVPGYLPPQAAIDGAFDDLKAHELAVIAGMRAALAAVVARFDPGRIESRLAEPARLDRWLPGARKARMWDRLVALYGELARDADEDLQRLFGEKFSSAYAQQVERLRAQAPYSTPD